jgi:thiosulfate/3-mercaptopyruvate sulfurtransferase
MKRFFSLCALFFWAAASLAEAAPLVTDQWLLANYEKPEVVVVDLQSAQGFQRAHVPGAVNTDYNQWRTGSRSPSPKTMPPVAELEKLIGGLGIDNTSHVVLAPFGQGVGDLASATRIYWTFKALGHDRVSILDGGLIGYARGGRNRPLASGAAQPAPKLFKAHLRPDYLADRTQVRAALDAGVALVDNRSRAEYLGIYGAGPKSRAGTIPGAVNLPYDWLTVNGGASFHAAEDLKVIYRAAGVPLEGEQISFCHTGHRTSLAWFVSHELLGNDKARMYDGSMADWSTDPAAPMQKDVDLQCKAC